MHEDEDRPPGVPGPREGGHELPGHPVVPAPRSAPALECFPPPAGTVVTITGRMRPNADAQGASSALRASRSSTAVAVRDESIGGRLQVWCRELGRAMARVVGAAVRALWSLLAGLAPRPSLR